MTENEKIVREACRVLWTEGDWERVGEFYSEDYKPDYPMNNEAWGTGVAGIQDYVKAVRTAFPDYKEEITELVAAGDKIIVSLRLTGTHTGPYGPLPATGRPVEFREVAIITVRDGKIVSQSGVTDNLAVFAQLGLVQVPQV